MSDDKKTAIKNRKAQTKRDKKIEKKRAKISKRAVDRGTDSFDVSSNATGSITKQKKEASQKNKRPSKPAAAKSTVKKQKNAVIKEDDSKEMNAYAPVNALNRNRLALGYAVLLIFIIALIFRMGYWQIYKSDDLRVMAADIQKEDNEIKPVRGTIYDSQMNILAESVTEYEIYAYTQALYKSDDVKEADKISAVKNMAEITGKKEKEIKKLFEGTDNLVKIAEGLTHQQVKKAEEVFGSNIVVKTKTDRYYPNGAFAAQILGGVNSEDTGLAGIEYEYNSTLAGIKGRTIRTTDNNGNTLSNGRSKLYKAQNGNSVVTTIDSVIQHFVEDALESGMERTGADAITCIVMEPKTGKILALASTPEYDPNNAYEPSNPSEKKKFDKMSDSEQSEYLSNMWKINAVSDIYEPGSTFKLIAAASALESGKANDNSTYKCSGGIRVDDYYLRCLHTHGKQNLKEAVGNSCNPALATVAMDMGASTFYNYIDLFGFNDQTGIDLPGEGYSIVKDPSDMSRVDLATTGYGQGIAVTPIQILCAVNSLGNDGVLMKPRIVDRIVDADGNTVETMPDVKVRQVVSEQTADKMKEIMEYYVSDAGGTTAYVPGYRVGGKTGTANRVSGSQYSSATNTSFVVMAPMDDPQISMICIVYRPTKLEYGAFTAGPIVKEITEKSLEYLGVERKYSKKEAQESQKSMVKVPDVTGMDSKEAITTLTNNNLKYTIMPETSSDQSFVVVDQQPKAGAKVEKDSIVYIYSE